MRKEIRKSFAIISIFITITVILFLLLSGYDISRIEIHKGIRVK